MSGVHPFAIMSVVFWVICSLSMFVVDASGDHIVFTEKRAPTAPQITIQTENTTYITSLTKT